MIEFKADVNAETKNGLKSLHWAAENGQTEVVKLLIAECGADANTKDDGRWTPLHWAAQSIMLRP